MKPVIVTTVYCNPTVYRAGMASLERTVPDYDKIMHIQLDNRYPLGKQELREAMREHTDKHPFSSRLDFGENLGLHGGLNKILEVADSVLHNDDVVIAIDADDDPQQVGWVSAMMLLFAERPDVGWISLMCEPGRDVLNQRGVAIDHANTGDVRYRIPGFPLINTVCAWRVQALRALGPIVEPHKYYGGIEVAMMPKFEEAGWRVAWLEDFTVASHRHLGDPIYERYKQRHVGHVKPVFPGSFDEYIAAGEVSP